MSPIDLYQMYFGAAMLLVISIAQMKAEKLTEEQMLKMTPKFIMKMIWEDFKDIFSSKKEVKIDERVIALQIEIEDLKRQIREDAMAKDEVGYSMQNSLNYMLKKCEEQLKLYKH